MRVLEWKIEANVCIRALVNWGVEGIKLNLQGRTGFPDRMFVLPNGRVAFIEFKQPGGHLGAKQRHTIAGLRKLSHDVGVFDSAEEALKWLGDKVRAARLSTQSNKIPD